MLLPMQEDNISINLDIHNYTIFIVRIIFNTGTLAHIQGTNGFYFDTNNYK